MRKALLAGLFLALAGCATSGAVVKGPSVTQPYDQKAMMTGLVPGDVGRVEPGFGTAPAEYGWADMGATPPCTLADIR
jgi:hypothetical protein